MGLAPIYQAPRTLLPHPENRVYPYLLRDLAIMDWATRAVLSWRLSNTMYPDFCVEALEEALSRYGAPEIFNTDQGGQFTSGDFTRVLKDAGVRISMDGGFETAQ